MPVELKSAGCFLLFCQAELEPWLHFAPPPNSSLLHHFFFFLRILMTSGLFYEHIFFSMIFFLYFVQCSNRGLAALLCNKKKATAAQFGFGTQGFRRLVCLQTKDSFTNDQFTHLQGPSPPFLSHKNVNLTLLFLPLLFSQVSLNPFAPS